MSLPLKGNVCPDYIKKKRTPKGVASYEIIWKDEHKCFEGLIPEEQMVAYLGEYFQGPTYMNLCHEGNRHFDP